MGTETAFLALAGVQVAGTAGSIFAARGQYAYEREILKLNERMALRAAEDALRRGDIEAGAVRRRARAMIGMQQAAFAASGVDPFSGSAAAIQEETAALSEFDRQAIRVAAFREAYGYRTKALEFSLQRRLARIGSRQAQSQAVAEGLANIASTGLTYAGSTRQRATSEPPSYEGVEHLLRAIPRY